MAATITRRALLVALLAGAGAAAAEQPRRLEKWRCTNQDCEPYIYDPSQGAENLIDEDHPIPPGVAFDALPDDWVCPVCGDTKAAFQPLGQWVTVGAGG